MAKHLTMRNRVIIQYEIEHNHHSTLKTISERINIDTSSLYREKSEEIVLLVDLEGLSLINPLLPIVTT